MIYGKPSIAVESAIVSVLLEETMAGKIIWTVWRKPAWWWYVIGWCCLPTHALRNAGYQYNNVHHKIVLRAGRKLSLWLNNECICDNQALLTPLLGAVTDYVGRSQEPYLRRALGLPNQGKEKEDEQT